MAEGLYIALQGSASNYVYNQPGSETASFEELCTVLDNRYGAAKSVAMDKRKLKERKKEKRRKLPFRTGKIDSNLVEMTEVKDDSEELTADEAWQLLLDQKGGATQPGGT